MTKIKKVEKLVRGKSMDEIVIILKQYGFSQMESVKFLINHHHMRLAEANEVVQNAECWSDFKDGNDDIKNTFFRS